MNTEIIETKIGFLKILSKNNTIYGVSFLDNKKKISNNSKKNFFYDEINDYFKGIATDFHSNIKLKGTSFQIKVWKEICNIPYGTTKSYSDIAKNIGLPNSCRAVANACGQNRIVLFVPCHRVVGKNALGGYKYGINKKKWLLELEKENI